MAGDIQKKLNQMLEEWPAHTLYLASHLKKRGISQQLTSLYVNSQWIERLGPGVFKRKNDRVEWHGALYAIQTQANKLIFPGGKTALSLYGFTHNLPKTNMGPLTLFTYENTELPAWFKNHDWGSKIRFKKTTLFSLPSLELTPLKFEFGYEIKISCPEQAIIELCALIPQSQSFEEAYNVMQGLLTLRPKKLQLLLEKCNSIKAKRVFLYLADICNMPWLDKIDLNKISLGTGKRQVVKDGKLDPKFLITVPKDSSEIKLEDIP